MRRVRRWAARTAAVAALAGVLWAAWPWSGANYLLRQAYFQIELLGGAIPVEDALADDRLSAAQRDQLRLVADIKAFGGTVGLSATTENYNRVHVGWPREIWNLSACHPYAFASKRWWFPVVGSMPYIGFFREQDARPFARDLQRSGWDVYLRTAGAYSTLGWFADPILPQMLSWSEPELADTLLHELTHATLWVPGSAQFNESFATVVGQHAALAWAVHRHGASSDEVRTLLAFRRDVERFREVQHQLYRALDALYRDPSVPRGDLPVRKGALFASLPVRVAQAGLSDPARFVRATQRGTWNNARLVQFRTYNRGQDWFEALLAQEGGDLPRFIARVRALGAAGGDPWAALAAAVGADPDDLDLGDG